MSIHMYGGDEEDGNWLNYYYFFIDEIYKVDWNCMIAGNC